MLQFWGREQRVALLGETTAGDLNSRGCAGCVVLSQDVETAGIATAGKIFHRTSVASGQNWPWFAAVLLFLLANLELETHKEPGSRSPFLCHIRHNGMRSLCEKDHALT